MSGLLWGVTVGPNYTSKELIPLHTKPRSMLPQSSLESQIVPLHESITLRILCRGIQLLHTQ